MQLVLDLVVKLLLVALHLLEVACHHFSIEVLLLGDLGFVPLESLLPSGALGRVSVLDDSRVVVGRHVATVMKGFHIAGELGSVPDEAIRSQVNMAV